MEQRKFVAVDKDVAHALKVRAAVQGVTMRELVTEVLRGYLDASPLVDVISGWVRVCEHEHTKVMDDDKYYLLVRGCHNEWSVDMIDRDGGAFVGDYASVEAAKHGAEAYAREKGLLPAKVSQ
jgi:hypothetical protein